MRLIYLSPVPWASFAQRPHQFVQWFHARTGGPVLWVDPYPTRFPNAGDLRRSRLAATSSEGSRVPAWLTVLKPGGLPIEPLPGSGCINGLLWRAHLRAILDYAAGGKTVLAIGKPSVLALKLLERLRHCASWYDAMDDFPAFYTGFSRFALIRREREIVKRVDIVLASSSALKSHWITAHQDVRLVHNGLSLLSVQAVTWAPVASSKKVFGYVGTLASWFDWEWVCTLAQSRPHDEIRLIGPMFQPPACNLPSNIHLLPACDHALALRAMAQFHVGLIPFKKNALTASVDPIKYYEYRALGLPVIATDFGEMSLRAGQCGVFISQAVSDVAAMAHAAIQFCADAGDTSAFAIQNNWEARFDAANLLS